MAFGSVTSPTPSPTVPRALPPYQVSSWGERKRGVWLVEGHLGTLEADDVVHGLQPDVRVPALAQAGVEVADAGGEVGEDGVPFHRPQPIRVRPGLRLPVAPAHHRQPQQRPAATPPLPRLPQGGPAPHLSSIWGKGGASQVCAGMGGRRVLGAGRVWGGCGRTREPVLRSRGSGCGGSGKGEKREGSFEGVDRTGELGRAGQGWAATQSE